MLEWLRFAIGPRLYAAGIGLLISTFCANAEDKTVNVLTYLDDASMAALSEQFSREAGIRVNWLPASDLQEVLAKYKVGAGDWDAILGLSSDGMAYLAKADALQPIADQLDKSWPHASFGDPQGVWLPVGAVYSAKNLKPDVSVKSEWDTLKELYPAEYEQPYIDGVAVFKNAKNEDSARAFMQWVALSKSASDILLKNYLLTPQASSPNRTIPRDYAQFLSTFGPGSCKSCKSDNDCESSQKCSAQGCCVSK